jgi:hypothetical protein
LDLTLWLACMKEKNTSLHRAAANGHCDMINGLIEMGAHHSLRAKNTVKSDLDLFLCLTLSVQSRPN